MAFLVPAYIPIPEGRGFTLDPVRLLGIQRRIVLVMRLGPIETFKRNDFRHNLVPEYLGRIELRNIRLSDFLLLFA